MSSRIVLPPLWFAVALAGAAAGQSSPVGEYTLEGKYSTQRRTAVTLKIERNQDGSFTLTRTGRYTGSSAASAPKPFTWVASNAIRTGNQVFGLYRVSIGLTGALAKAQPNVFLGRYTLASDGLGITEMVMNQTRRAPEHFWSLIRTEGKRVVTAADLDAIDQAITAKLDAPGVAAAREALKDIETPVRYAAFMADGASLDAVKASLAAREQTDLAVSREGEDAVRAMADAIREPLDWAIQDEDGEVLFQPIRDIADAVLARFLPATGFRSITLLTGEKQNMHGTEAVSLLVVEDQGGRFYALRASLTQGN